MTAPANWKFSFSTAARTGPDEVSPDHGSEPTGPSAPATTATSRRMTSAGTVLPRNGSASPDRSSAHWFARSRETMIPGSSTATTPVSEGSAATAAPTASCAVARCIRYVVQSRIWPTEVIDSAATRPAMPSITGTRLPSVHTAIATSMDTMRPSTTRPCCETS